MSHWYKQAVHVMSLAEALRVFEFPANSRPSKDEIKSRYRQLARKYHPDVTKDQSKMVNLNNANDALEKYNFSGSSGNSYKPQNPAPKKPSRQEWGDDMYDDDNAEEVQPKSGYHNDNFNMNDAQKMHDKYQAYARQYAKQKAEEDAKWQTDPYATSNSTGTNDFRDVNFCKKKIYENALAKGADKTQNLTKYQFMAFDGWYFRGTFTAYCTAETLDYAGEVMQKWNSEGSNPYKTEAVITSREGKNQWKVIRLNGRPCSIDLQTPEQHPINDKGIVKELQKIIKERSNKVDFVASWYGQAKHSQYLDGGDALQPTPQFLDPGARFFPKKDKSKPRKDKKGLTECDPNGRPAGA